MENPFSNIKAVHLNNDEIVNYWVDINNGVEQKKFLDVIEPTNPRPLIILGGKGSGKTHILRFCSYNAQKVRAEKSEHRNILKQLSEEKYTSILLELGNFQFERFSGSKLDSQVWQEWYFYYFNIILIEAFLEQVIDLQKNGLDDIETDKIHEMYKNYFFNPPEEGITIDYMYKKIKQEHKNIDRAFSKLRTGIVDTLDLEDLLFDTRSNVFFDISYYILEASPSLRNIRLLYLLDQFEDLSKEQQQFINTIIRHPRYTERISIRVAGRLYSIKEEKTFSDNEKNSYAEVTKKYLEDYLDNSSSYKQFTIDLINKRLNNNETNKFDDKYLIDSFRKFDKDEITNKILQTHPNSQDRKYFITLTKQLEQYKQELGLSTADISKIISNLSYPSDPIIEKQNIWLLYQGWSKNEQLLYKSIQINNSILKKDTNIHSNETLKHLQNTFYFQLCRDYSIQYFNSGFDKIISFSHANPRNFMLILSEIYGNAKFSEEMMFDINNPIKCKTQDKAIKDASEEFWKYAIIDIENNFVVRMVERINSFFKAIRISDKPTEKTLIAFSYTGTLSEDSKTILTNAVNHMLLIKKTNAKKEKNNSGAMLDIYSVPAILTAKWDLHIARGGTCQFAADEIELLCLGDDNEWASIHKEYISRYNVPFTKLYKTQKNKLPLNTPSLFKEDGL
jgi:hypothetical protein